MSAQMRCTGLYPHSVNPRHCQICLNIEEQRLRFFRRAQFEFEKKFEQGLLRQIVERARIFLGRSHKRGNYYG